MSRTASGFKRTAAVALLGAAVALPFVPAPAEEPKLQNIDGAIRAASKDILKELRVRGYKNVGVLKFLVADGDGALPDDKRTMRSNVGPLNRTLADRLEVALALLLDDDDKLGIISRASDAAADNPRSDFWTETGRKALFAIRPDKFSVPWRLQKPVEPDAFLSGKALISKDHRTVAVKVQLIERKALRTDDPVTIKEFTAMNDTRTLIETGVTFKRGADFEEQELLARADKVAPAAGDNHEALQKKADEALKVLQKSPVKLEILYNGIPQPVKTDAGDHYATNVLLRVSSPKKGNEVAFRLTNTDDNNTYGVVLRLNGYNTIYEERQDPVACRKWVLAPHESVKVIGFQKMKTNTADPFTVLSPEESEAEAINYGDNAGTFDLIVFRGGRKPESAVAEVDKPRASVSRGTMILHDEPTAMDLASFKAQLLKESGKVVDASRGTKGGMIVKEGKEVENKVQMVEFYPEPLPDLSATIRYYSLKK